MKSNRVWRMLLAAIILAGLVGLGVRAYYLAALARPSGVEVAQAITINPGVGVFEIAKVLKDKNLINSEALFKLYLKLNRFGPTLEAGAYEIPPRLNLSETVALLQHGTFDLKLTFPEGWRREEMARYVGTEVSGLGFGEADFLAASEGMEGYLFPETYFVPRGVTAAELVVLMRKTFDERFGEDLRSEASGRGLPLPEVVILASIVEREVKFDADRPKVAGVLVKRWRNNWPLEADATTQFAVASARASAGTDGDFSWWPKNLTQADLEMDSPYNTRKYRGLPPGPIANPGLEALTAVVDYEETPAWFYVSDRDGKIYFSETLDEHHQKVVEYTAD